MPANAGIHAFLSRGKDVDGWDKPGHDDRAGLHPFISVAIIRQNSRIRS
jgi:hypothetical protein